MALSFTSTNRVSHGSAASINNLAQGANGFSVLAWTFLTSTPDNNIAGTRSASNTGAWVLLKSGNNIRFYCNNNGTDTDYVSSSGAMVQNKDVFVGCTYDSNVSPAVDLYAGDLATKAFETTYSTSTDGALNPKSDTGIDLVIGNLAASPFNRPWPGRISRLHILNKKLSIDEVIQQQYKFFPTANTVLLVEYDVPSATQIDLSGLGNHGTVTGTSQADHVPLHRIPDRYVGVEEEYIVTAGGVTIQVPLGTFDLAGQVPIIGTGVNVQAPAKSYTLTGQTPTINIGVNVQAPFKAYTLTGFGPAVPPVGVPLKQFNLNGFAPTIDIGVNVLAPVKAYSLAGFGPAVPPVSMPFKAYTLNGFAPTIAIGVNVLAPVKAYTLTGLVPTIQTGAGVNIQPPVGTFDIAGQTPAVGTGVIVAPPVFEYKFAYQPNGIRFNPTPSAQYLTRGGGLTGVTDGKSGILSLWVKTGSFGSFVLLASDAAAGGFLEFAYSASTDRFRLVIDNLTGTEDLLDIRTTKTFPSGVADWTHFLIGWDVAQADGFQKFIVNGIDDTNLVIRTDQTLSYAAAEWSVGAGVFGGLAYDGDIADVYLALNETLDFSSAANIKKFYGTWPGPTGKKPTGNQPAIWLSGDVSSWHTNKGSGGGFTVNNGPLTNATTDAPFPPPAVGTSVLVQAPSGTFTLTGFIPSIQTGVNVQVPLGIFTITGLTPAVGVGVEVITPLGTFTLAGFAPTIETGVNIQVPSKAFTLLGFVPTVNEVNVFAPFKAFDLVGQTPSIIAGGIAVQAPSKAYTLAGQAPDVELLHEIKVPAGQFSLTGINPAIHTSGYVPVTIAELDLTPPFEDVEQIRWLFRNLDIIRENMKGGVTGQYTTADGKTVLVKNGIIVDIF